jgi:hypothetical protein
MRRTRLQAREVAVDKLVRGGLGGWPAVAMIDRAYGHLGR